MKKLLWFLGIFFATIIGWVIGYSLISLISSFLTTYPVIVATVFASIFTIALIACLVCYRKKKTKFFYPGIIIPFALSFTALSFAFGIVYGLESGYNKYGFLEYCGVRDRFGILIFKHDRGLCYWKYENETIIAQFWTQGERMGEKYKVLAECSLFNNKGDFVKKIQKDYWFYKCRYYDEYDDEYKDGYRLSGCRSNDCKTFDDHDWEGMCVCVY